MRIAIPFSEERVETHFGHCAAFLIYTIENQAITGRMLLPTQGSGHKYMTHLMKKMKIDVVLAGHMGKPAILALREFEIQVYMSVSGEVEPLVQQFLKGELEQFNTNNMDIDSMQGACHCHES